MKLKKPKGACLFKRAFYCVIDLSGLYTESCARHLIINIWGLALHFLACVCWRKCSENGNSKGKVNLRGKCPYIKWGTADSYYKWALQPPLPLSLEIRKGRKLYSRWILGVLTLEKVGVTLHLNFTIEKEWPERDFPMSFSNMRN